MFDYKIIKQIENDCLSGSLNHFPKEKHLLSFKVEIFSTLLFFVGQPTETKKIIQQQKYADGGVESVEHGKEWGLEKEEEYTAKGYHSPFDEFDANSRDFSGWLNIVSSFLM